MTGRRSNLSKYKSALALLSTVSVGLKAGLAFAQDNIPPLPATPHIDQNSVNLDTGELISRVTDLSIGPDDHRGLRYDRQWIRNGWKSADVPVMTGTQYNLSVNYGDRSYPLYWDGNLGKYVEDGGVKGYSLSADRKIFSAPDGTVINFQLDTYSLERTQLFLGRATSIVFPDGIVKTITYKTGQNICVGGPCSLHSSRISSINLSNGYQLKFEYIRDTVPYNWGSNNETTQWTKIKKVTALNGAQEYCDPAASACTFSGNWPEVSYSYSSDYQDLLSVTDPEGRVLNYSYNNTRLSTVRAPGSPQNVSEISYSAVSGQTFKVTSVKSASQTWHYAYENVDASTLKTVITDPLSHTREVRFWGPKRLKIRDVDEIGRTTSYEYCLTGWANCPADLLWKTTFPEQNAVSYAYDPRGNVTRTVFSPKPGSGLGSLETSATYDPVCANQKVCNRPLTTTDLSGQVTNYEYDPSSGLPTKITLPAPVSGASRPEVRTNYVTLHAWVKNSAGTLVASPYGARYPQSSSTCSSEEAATCVGTAKETVTIYSYAPVDPWAGTNVLPNTVTIRSGNNDPAQTTTFTTWFDSIGNVSSQSDGAGNFAQFRYNKARQLTASWTPDPDGSGPARPRATTVNYGAKAQPEYVAQGPIDYDGSNFAGIQYRFLGYDDYGRLVSDRVHQGGVDYSLRQIAYDALGRTDCVALRMEPAVYSALSGYSACSQGPQAASNPDRITKYHWDWSGDLEKTISGYGTPTAQDDARFERNSNGSIVRAFDGKGNVTSYEFDGHDRLLRTCFNTANCSVSAADKILNIYGATGNGAGRLIGKGLRGHSESTYTSFTYDNLGRLKVAGYPGGGYYDSPVTFTYDNLGQVVRADDANGHSATFAYDALGRVMSQGDSISTRTMLYDANGRRTRLTWPDGRYVTYQFNATGDMVAILENGASTLASFGYDELGRRSSLTRGNGTVTSYSYDGASRLRCLTHDLAGGGGPSCTPTGVAATNQDQATLFAYNSAGQITSRTTANDAFAWTRHFNVNRGYTVNALNQYTASGSVVPTYDVKGNLATAGGAATYAYSTKNQLVSRSDTGAGFYHDPLGRLESFLNVAGGNYSFQYVDSQISDEVGLTGGNPILRRYVHGPGADEPIVWYEGADFTNKRYLVADERGSVVAVTDASGAATAINSYDEYGIPGRTNQGRFQYTGQAWLSELGMYSYKARIYSPTLGRFLQTDPIGYGDGMNWYNYVHGDPVNGTDPSGTADLGAGSGNNGCLYANVTCSTYSYGGEIVVSARVSNPSSSMLGSSGGTGLGWGPWSSGYAFPGGSAAPSYWPPSRSFGAAAVAQLPQSGSNCAAGTKAANLSQALGYSGRAHDLFGGLAEAGGGAIGKKAFAPLGVALNAVSAGSTFVSSIQRGEPVDVAYMRASSPLVGGLLGGVGGAAVGAAGGGAAGSVVPFLGNGVGAIGGGIAGGIGGSIVGEKLGEVSAEAYAQARGYGGC